MAEFLEITAHGVTAILATWRQEQQVQFPAHLAQNPQHPSRRDPQKFLSPTQASKRS